jgi:predicted DCC family thiol-disulfide oxidoreductase YuxK
LLSFIKKYHESGMKYYVIYDGDCNLCVSLVQILEQLDRGKKFIYTPMQDKATLTQLKITPSDCEKGMILINASKPQKRWQGSDAAEEIGKLLPTGNLFVDFYRGLPGIKNIGDNFYAFIRDNRYSLFGKRKHTYQSDYPFSCHGNHCNLSD